ncbi:MAG: calcium/sodium antiporter [Bradymonadales bacterium]|nr:calcium/sodium antiporter [Bradymonadales bacterium]
MWTDIILFLAGLACLIGGAEWLVRGASRIATRLGISPLVVGLTIVAFGTSAPELAISTFSTLSGKPDLAFGNVVGSNIFNVLAILGVTAIAAPIVVARQLIRFDVPIMIGGGLLMTGMALDGRIGRLDGLILAALLVSYIAFSVVMSRREAVQQEQPIGSETNGSAPARGRSLPYNVVLILLGLTLLVLGSRWLVDSATVLARYLGVSELIIGLTVVAAGTSLPELATSVVAAVRGERDIAVGNVVGSNIFNIFAVLGIASAVSPSGIAVAAPALHFDVPVMLAAMIACLPIFFSGYRIARSEGLLLFGFFLAYMLYLFLNATHHSSLNAYSGVMLWFVIPLTFLTLLIISWRFLVSERKKRASR